jgi:hypothetical protein
LRSIEHLANQGADEQMVTAHAVEPPRATNERSSCADARCDGRPAASGRRILLTKILLAIELLVQSATGIAGIARDLLN